MHLTKLSFGIIISCSQHKNNIVENGYFCLKFSADTPANIFKLHEDLKPFGILPFNVII